MILEMVKSLDEQKTNESEASKIHILEIIVNVAHIKCNNELSFAWKVAASYTHTHTRHTQNDSKWLREYE